MAQLSGNKISILTSKLALCTKLVTLELSQNGLRAFQGRIYDLKKLKRLNLSSNQLQVLPSAIGWLPLVSLHLDDNPQLRVPSVVKQATADHGIRAMLTYHQIACEQHRVIDHHLDSLSQHSSILRPPEFVKAGVLHIHHLQAITWINRPDVLMKLTDGDAVMIWNTVTTYFQFECQQTL
jgi:Leucine-rich repeat (LRR) protein